MVTFYDVIVVCAGTNDRHRRDDELRALAGDFAALLQALKSNQVVAVLPYLDARKIRQQYGKGHRGDCNPNTTAILRVALESKGITIVDPAAAVPDVM